MGDIYDQQLGFKNPILEAYIEGMELRRARQRQAFQESLQTEQEKRLEQQRQDTVKRFEDQIKFQRERLAFDREKETADNKYRVLQGKKLELDMKKLGFEMLASGQMQGEIDSADQETINRGLDELYNTSQYGGVPSTSVSPYTKKDIEIAPGINLGKNWQFPWEAGQAELQQKGPLELLKQEGRERASVIGMLRAMKIQEAGAGYREEADKRTQTRQEARDEAQFEKQKILRDIDIENQERLAKFKAGLEKGGGGPTRQNKIASLRALSDDIKYVLEMGEKTNWSGHSFLNAIPGVEEFKTARGSDTPDERRYKSALNRLTADQINQIYGAVLARNEGSMARGFVAQTWMNKNVAKDRLMDFLRQTQGRLKYLESGGKLEEEGGTGMEGWTEVPGSGKLGGPGILNKPPEPPLFRQGSPQQQVYDKWKKK